MSSYSSTPATPAPVIKAIKKIEKKRSSMMNEMLLMLPFMMYAGAGRHVLTFDNKRKLIKMAQIQELVLHTIPLGALIWYNNSTDIEYDETLDTMLKVVFCMSLLFNLIEIVIFYYYKVSGKNLEVNKTTGKAKAAPSLVKVIGAVLVLLTGIAVIVGTQAFNEK